MDHFNQRGVVNIIFLIILVAGIAAGVVLVGDYTRFFPKAAEPDIAFEADYNPFGDPWATKLSPNTDVPVALTTGCYRRGSKQNSDPSVSDQEIRYLSKSNVPFIFEECASLLGPNAQASTNKQRLINIGTKLKQTNPNVKYIGYHVFWDVNFDGNMGSDIWVAAERDEMCGSVKCETFFVHKKGQSPTKANRITGSRTFDITNPNFRQYIIPKVVRALNDLNMDGFLADGVSPTIPGANMAEVPDDIAANWGRAWAELFKETKEAIGPNKYLFANSGGQGVNFSRTLITPESGSGKGRADGIMWEDPMGPLALDFKSSGRLNELNSMLSTAANLNKYLMIVVNTNVNCTNASGQPRDYCFKQTNKEREQAFAKYYLAAYLNLFKNDKTMLVYYTPIKSSPQFDSETYFRIWDLRIGQPTSGMQEVSEGVYLRTFQKAHVYFNNSNSNYNARAAGLYNLNGTPANNQVLPAKTGAIFVTQQVLQEWIPPSPSVSPSVSESPSSTKPEVISAKSFSYCVGNVSRNHLEWKSIPNSLVYKVFRETPIPGSGIKSGETSGTGWNDHTGVAGTEYTYFIEAALPNGVSLVSEPYKIRTVSCEAPTASTSPVPSPTPTPSPSPTPTSTPVVSEQSVTQIDVRLLEKQTKANYYQSFYTWKSNEIAFLLSRSWTNRGTVFKAPAAGTQGALMAKRMVFTDYANQAQITTWATNRSDINEFKSLGFSELNDADFYAFSNQETGTVGVTRMKYYSPTYNKTFYTFAKSQSEIDTLTSRGWSVQKSNIFYVYP